MTAADNANQSLVVTAFWEVKSGRGSRGRKPSERLSSAGAARARREGIPDFKVGEFNRLGKHLTLRIDRSENKGTQLQGIFVESEDGKGMTLAATAEQGRFLATDDPDKILFRLTNGRLVQD